VERTGGLILDRLESGADAIAQSREPDWRLGLQAGDGVERSGHSFS
jgi:hypothetical protein